MRLMSITVKQLFGVFDHYIPLGSTERVTIIHGPNGFGKTVILRMVAGCFQGKRQVFEHTPFAEFRLAFDDGTARIIRRHVQEPSDTGIRQVRLEFLLEDANGQAHPTEPLLPTEVPASVLTQVDQLVPGPYNLSGAGCWIDDEGTEYELPDIIRMFPLAASALPPEYRPKHLFEDSENIRVFFIETNRLGVKREVLDQPVESHGARSVHRLLTRRQPSRVQQYSADLVHRIRSVLADYAKHSQESDRTFPERLVRFVRERQSPLPPRDILDQMTEIENKRRRLISLGLLDSETGLRDLTEDDIRSVPEALTIYVGDIQEKLKAFDDLADRIGSLMDILNDRFKYKRLMIDRQHGFRVISDLKQRIHLDDLSSGEQHELVVLYELLFRAPKNALVLVDEPEISLHVAWQSRFLSDLIDILAVTDAYAIVATHSPVVIGARWDLAVELKGPEAARDVGK